MGQVNWKSPLLPTRGNPLSAQNNLSVTLFRGVKSHPNNVGHYRIGEHWTEDPEIAKGFATVGTIKGEYDPSEGHGTVLEAKVDKDDIIPPYSKEWEERGGGDLDSGVGIFGPDSIEKEQTLRFGSKVTLTKLHHFHKGQKVGELPPKDETGIV